MVGKNIFLQKIFGMKSFGASGPYKKLYEHFGITFRTLKKINKKKDKINIMRVAINGFGRIGKLYLELF